MLLYGARTVLQCWKARAEEADGARTGLRCVEAGDGKCRG